ncbi:choice-of-anchor U domain-containing protein, partial [Shewanella sp.]
GSTVEVDEADWQLIGDNLIQVSITDGGELDEDGVANGTIVDPVTVGVLTSTATTSSGSSSGGSLGLLELLLGVFGLGLLTRISKN